MRADVVWASCFARAEVVEQVSHTWYTSGDLVYCREVEGGPTALLMELFFGECPPFAVRRLELPLEYFSLLFGVRNKASFFCSWWLAQSQHLQRLCSGRPSMLSAAGTGLLFWVVCTGPSVPLCLASASSWRHGPSFWWNGEWRVGEIQGLLSLTRACLCGLQSLIAVRRVSLNRVHIFSEVAESFSGSILSARSVMALLSWSQSAALYSGTSLGTCFLSCGWMITSQCTTS